MVTWVPSARLLLGGSVAFPVSCGGFGEHHLPSGASPSLESSPSPGNPPFPGILPFPGTARLALAVLAPSEVVRDLLWWTWSCSGFQGQLWALQSETPRSPLSLSVPVFLGCDIPRGLCHRWHHGSRVWGWKCRTQSRGSGEGVTCSRVPPL